MAYKRKRKNPRHKHPRKPWKAHTKAALLRKAKAAKIKGAAAMKKSQLIWHLARKCKKPATKRVRKACRRKISRKKLTVKQLISRIKRLGGKRYSGKRRASLVRMYGALKRKRR